MISFIDSDFAGDLADRKKTLGYTVMLGLGEVSWSSRKQSIVTLSTTGSEFVATAACACQAIWLRKILEKIHFKQKGPTLIYYDSSSVIKLSKNPVLHGRSKHIDVKFQFLRDLTKDHVIDLIFCRSDDDVFTKSLKLALFVKFRKLLGACTLKDQV